MSLEAWWFIIYFNSIKVRLKHFIPQRFEYRPKFQFHKGTIKTWKVKLQSLITTRFQFHKGTIKTRTAGTDDRGHAYFNSIKVRLKRKSALAWFSYVEVFQFHKGTIKTSAPTCLYANSTSKCKITKCFCKSTPLVLRNSISFLVSH